MSTRAPTLFAFVLLVPPIALPAAEKEVRWLPVRDLLIDQVNPTLLMIDDEETRETREEPRVAIAVRGVFPIQRQQDLVSKSSQHTGEVSFIDYFLERQAMPQNAPPQSEPKWERVNVEVAQSIVRYSAGTDQVITDSSMIAPVFTMPLPARADGRWNENVTHPKLKKQGEQLLFRYLDFDVEPGTYYRYRVRLKVANPLHGSQTENPFLASGATRKTPWSRPSPAILVTGSK